MIAFGPVSSRRLGLSLGINNILSHKLCTYSCVYCQLGRTQTIVKNPVLQHDPDVLVREVYHHLAKLEATDHPDFLTFVARGEPTLDSNLGKEITRLKETGIPVAVISNASLLSVEEVRQQLIHADWVSVKIDAVDENIWKNMNRPHRNLQLEIILEGVKSFCAEYSGTLCTETMLVRGFNDDRRHLQELAAFVKKLGPSIAYLSVPTRPPHDKKIQPSRGATLTEAWEIYNSHHIKTELLTGFEGTRTGSTGNPINDILNITAVHPLREDSLKKLLEETGCNISIVNSLIHQRLLEKTEYRGNNYYTRYYPGI